jgi:hypothetical protein
MNLYEKTIVKAIQGENDSWELDVLTVPFGDPEHLDSDQEYFSPNTDLHLEQFREPLAVYYHGFNEEGHPMENPAIIGRVRPDSWAKRENGWWVRIALDKTAEYAKRVWDAAKKGIARASSATAAHLFRKRDDGEIINWPIVEISLFDAEGRRQPANPCALALPVIKSLYEQAGIALPDSLADETVKGEQQRTAESNAEGGEEPQRAESQTVDQLILCMMRENYGRERFL